MNELDLQFHVEGDIILFHVFWQETLANEFGQFTLLNCTWSQLVHHNQCISFISAILPRHTKLIETALFCVHVQAEDRALRCRSCTDLCSGRQEISWQKF